ncbi:hypothetical protein DM828_05420 [Pseudomonas umsongensis]|nr:hypothetical protein [Pseudomonas umsongensis]
MGASLLAMDVNDNAHCLDERVARKSIASMLAPTGVIPVPAAAAPPGATAVLSRSSPGSRR